MKSLKTSVICGAALAATVFSFNKCGFAQDAPAAATASPQNTDTLQAVHDLQEQVRQLRSMVDEMRAENVQSRSEMQHLRQELKDTRSLLEKPMAQPANQYVAGPPAASDTQLTSGSATADGTVAVSSPAANTIEERVEKLEESTSLLNSRVAEHAQTKVETASKYHARLSGIVLMNMFHNHGPSDNADFPNYALPLSPGVSQSAFGATLRQSEIGLEIFGPTVAGARTSANIQLDFSGGFPSTANGVNFGMVRLQTASMRLDWGHTSVIAGQDSLFVSPLSPTSFASLAVPTFAYAGNLWGWTPQIRVEHRFDLSDRQTITVQAGIMDNLTWEPNFDSYDRTLQSGEQTGQPAYAARTAWSMPVFGHPLTFGVAGYYGRQDWSWDRYNDGWAGMADWQVPLARRLTLSGEFYRGRGAGGLGAGIGRAVVFGGSPYAGNTPIRALNSAGGWSQLKLQLTSKLEINGVFAEDDAFTADIRGFATDDNNFGPIQGRNRGALGNFVFRPRSDLLFSAEFRRLRTFPVYTSSSVTNQINLAMGILF